MADELGTLDLWASEQIDVLPQTENILTVREQVIEPVTTEPQTDDEALESEGLLDITLNHTLDGQVSFIDPDEWWKVEWQGMPEFIQEDKLPWKSMYVHFRCREDLIAFGKLLDQRLTVDTPSIWWPVYTREKVNDRAYCDE